MHRVRIAGIQPGVRQANGHSGPAEASLLRDRGCSGMIVITADDLRSEFVNQFPPGRALDPQNRAGLCQRIEAAGLQLTP